MPRGNLKRVRPLNVSIFKDTQSLHVRRAIVQFKPHWSDPTAMSKYVSAREKKLASIATRLNRVWRDHGKSASGLNPKEHDATLTLYAMLLTKACHLRKLAKRISPSSFDITEALDIIDYFNRDAAIGPWKSWYYGAQLGLAKPEPLGKSRLKRMHCLLSKQLREQAGGMDTTDNTQ